MVRRLLCWSLLFASAGLVACEGSSGRAGSGASAGAEDDDQSEVPLSPSERLARATAIRDAHAAHGLIDNPVIFAGIAQAETSLAHCYHELAAIGCPGEFASADCGGEVILAGGADGTCEQGGLGMFQFDQGTQTQTKTFWDTTGYWPLGAPTPRDVVSLSGNVQASIDFVMWKAWHSGVTPLFADEAAMYDWINGIRPVDGTEDFELWLGFLAHNYNGWGWNTAGWATAKEKYRDATHLVHQEFGGDDFWYGEGDGGGEAPGTPCWPEGGLWCGGNGVPGDMDTLYVCAGGMLQVQEVCEAGCQHQPPGFPDACNPGGGGGEQVGCGWSFPVGDAPESTAPLSNNHPVGGNNLPHLGTHLGADYWSGGGCTDLGKTVYAVADGTVVEIVDGLGSFLDVVVIRHEDPAAGAVYSMYGHIQRSAGLEEGDAVSGRQVIGEVDDVLAYFSPCHLHFELLSEVAFNEGPFCNGCEAVGFNVSPGYDRGVGVTPGADPSGDTWLEVDDDIVGNRWYDADAFISARLATECDDEEEPEPPELPTCGQLSEQEGYINGACEWNGNGACNGMGPATSDCDHCCDVCDFGTTCGDLAAEQGWAAAACEWNGNGACAGSGTPTCDCDVCCEV
ncbi:MAG: M23 family metallopeptidase [Myxococcota bacterium]